MSDDAHAQATLDQLRQALDDPDEAIPERLRQRVAERVAEAEADAADDESEP